MTEVFDNIKTFHVKFFDTFVQLG